MTSEQDQKEKRSTLQKSFTSDELALAKQLAQQAARNLQPGSAPPVSPPITSPSPNRLASSPSRPRPQPLPPTMNNQIFTSKMLDYQSQLRVHSDDALSRKLSYTGVEGGLPPKPKLLGGSVINLGGMGTTTTINHFRNNSSPSNSSPRVPLNRGGLTSSQLPVPSSSSALVHQQLLGSDLYKVAARQNASNMQFGGYLSRESSPTPQVRMNGGESNSRRNEEGPRSGHSLKMVHSYASGKTSPVGFKPNSIGSRPPIYPNVNTLQNGAPSIPSSQLRTVASLSGSLSARGQPRRSSMGSTNTNGLEPNEFLLGGMNSRHARNNSTPGQLDALDLGSDYRTLLVQQQLSQQKQVAGHHLRGGSNMGDSLSLDQQQQLLSAQLAIQQNVQEKQVMQQLLLQNPNASTTDIYRLLNNENLGMANSSAAALNHLPTPRSLHSSPPMSASLQSSLPTPTPTSTPQIPPKLELYAQLLGGSQVAEQNLAAIPEIEAQIFSAVADLLYEVLLGVGVEEVLGSITAIAQFTRNSQALFSTPMPQAFAAWMRRVALVMPLITAVYQARGDKHIVREGFTTLIKILAEPYPRLDMQLESLIGMGEAAAACVLDSNSLWRQVLALLSDKESKLRQMEVHSLEPSLRS